MLEGKTVLLGVTGSIAAYKIAYLASALKKQQADVHVLMTRNATNLDVYKRQFKNRPARRPGILTARIRMGKLEMCIRDRDCPGRLLLRHSVLLLFPVLLYND